MERIVEENWAQTWWNAWQFIVSCSPKRLSMNWKSALIRGVSSASTRPAGWTRPCATCLIPKLLAALNAPPDKVMFPAGAACRRSHFGRGGRPQLRRPTFSPIASAHENLCNVAAALVFCRRSTCARRSSSAHAASAWIPFLQASRPAHARSPSASRDQTAR